MSNKNSVKKKDETINKKEVEKKVKGERKNKLQELAEDENASIFKRVAVLSGILLIAFALVLIFIKVFFTYQGDQNLKNISILGNAKYYGLMVESVDSLDEYTSFSTEMKSDLESKAKYAVKNYKKITIDSSKVAGLLLIDKHLNMGKYDELIDYMREYYDSDSKLFKEMKDDENKTADDLIANTINISYLLRRYDDVLDEFEIYDGLANWYNEKLKSADSSKYNTAMSEVFFLMYEKNKQSMLETDGIKEILEETYAEFKTKIDDDQLSNSIGEVLIAKRISQYRQMLYNDGTYIDSAQDIYEDIENEEGLMFDTYGKEYAFAISDLICSVDDIEANEFVTKKLGETLEKYYNDYLDE